MYPQTDNWIERNRIAEPVGGTLMTPGYKVVLTLVAIGFLAIVYRFAVGLGASTSLSDGYPWGIWIAYDVVTGTAIACGGYAVAILVYIFNKGRYHPLVRPAILTSALGYTLAGLSVAIDVGRPWHLWKIPVQIWKWNGNSVLLEVAVCIMAYIGVLWLELSPAILEGWKDSDHEKRRAFAEKSLPVVNKALIYIIALGMLLPTMHQSSLGSLMMLAGPRLHPLWFSPFLPLYFLITCIGMGYAVVCFESTAAAKFFHTPLEIDMLSKLDEMAAAIGGFFVLMRLFEVGARGNLGLAFQPTFFAFAFWCETLLFLGPWFVRLASKRMSRLQRLVGSGMLVVIGGAVYRFDVFLVGFQPGTGWRYFPSLTEVLITAGLVAGEAATYILIIKKFPILSGVTTRPAPEKPVTAAAPGVVAPAH
jgi:Ni/Fe-hydrogenase subunit HybB-like protein